MQRTSHSEILNSLDSAMAAPDGDKSKEIKLQTRPLRTLPEVVKFKDVNPDGSLKIDDEKKVELCISQTGTDSPKKEGIILCSESKLDYDVLFGENFRGYVYPVCVGKGSFGEVYPLFDGKEWCAVKYQASNYLKSTDSDADHELKETPKSNEFIAASQAGIGKKEIRFGTKVAYVMQWLPGMECDTFLNLPFVTPHQRYRVTKSTFRCVIDIHARRIAHLDIKPVNFKASQSYQIKACDFGFSVALDGDKTLVPVEMHGTPIFMPSEIFFPTSLQMCGFKADTFSLGMSVADLYDLVLPELDGSFNKLFTFKGSRLIADAKVSKKAPPEDLEKLHTFLSELTHAEPAKRPLLRDAERKLDSVFEKSRAMPLIKMIIDLEELKKIIDHADNPFDSRARECKKSLLEFQQVLRLANYVTFVELKSHTLVEDSAASRALTIDKMVKDENEVTVPEMKGINITPDVYFAEGSLNILDVVAAVPRHETGTEDDFNGFYVHVTTQRFKERVIGDGQVCCMTPEEILKIVRDNKRFNKDELMAYQGRLFVALSSTPSLKPHELTDKNRMGLRSA
jgi:serine/threonine protein kinase